MAEYRGPVPVNMTNVPGQQRPVSRPSPIVVVDKKPRFSGSTFTLPDASSKKRGWKYATQTKWQKSQDEMQQLAKKKIFGNTDVTPSTSLEDLPVEAQARIERWMDEKEGEENEPELYEWTIASIKTKTKSAGLFGGPAKNSIDVILKRVISRSIRDGSEPSPRSPKLRRPSSDSNLRQPTYARRASSPRPYFPRPAEHVRPNPLPPQHGEQFRGPLPPGAVPHAGFHHPPQGPALHNRPPQGPLPPGFDPRNLHMLGQQPPGVPLQSRPVHPHSQSIPIPVPPQQGGFHHPGGWPPRMQQGQPMMPSSAPGAQNQSGMPQAGFPGAPPRGPPGAVPGGVTAMKPPINVVDDYDDEDYDSLDDASDDMAFQSRPQETRRLMPVPPAPHPPAMGQMRPPAGHPQIIQLPHQRMAAEGRMSAGAARLPHQGNTTFANNMSGVRPMGHMPEQPHVSHAGRPNAPQPGRTTFASPPTYVDQEAPRRASNDVRRSKRPEVFQLSSSSDNESVLTSTDDNLSTRTPLTPGSIGEEIPYRKKSSRHRRSSPAGRLKASANAVYRMHQRRDSNRHTPGNQSSHHRSRSGDDDREYVLINKSRRHDAVRPNAVKYTMSGALSKDSAEDLTLVAPPRSDPVKDMHKEARRSEINKRQREIDRLSQDLHELQIQGHNQKIEDMKREKERRIEELTEANHRRRLREIEDAADRVRSDRKEPDDYRRRDSRDDDYNRPGTARFERSPDHRRRTFYEDFRKPRNDRSYTDKGRYDDRGDFREGDRRHHWRDRSFDRHGSRSRSVFLD